MGRKIKGRKHKGVRDPEKQREVKLLSIKDKINAPPTNPDEQHIPKSLTHIVNLKERVKSGAISLKRKRKPKKKSRPVSSHPFGRNAKSTDKPVPFFEQRQGESDNRFMYRVNQICKSVMEEAAFENKYNVDIKRNPETGQVEKVEKRKKDELELYLTQIKKENKSKKGNKKKKKSTEVKLTKSQKRQVKIKQKKENKLELNKDEFKNYEDTVKFGEVVHEPPNLSAPRKVKVDEKSKPGKKDLLLKSMFSSDTNAKLDTASKDNLNKVANKVIDKKGKRKDLPHAMRRQLDKQQKEVIEAYKKLKQNRYKSG